VTAGQDQAAADGGFCRVTVVGDRRRADVVLPAGERVGLLVPDLLELLGDRAGSPPLLRQLLAPDGAALDGGSTLAEAGVRDGMRLRLVHVQESPAAPIVHDVTDEVADDLGRRAWRWGPGPARWTTTAVLTLLALVAAETIRRDWTPAAAATALAVATLVLIQGGGALAVFRQAAGTAAVLAGGAVGVLAAMTESGAHQWSGAALLVALAAVVADVLAVLGATSPLGRAGLVGALFVVGLVGVWELTLALLDGPAPRRLPEVGAVLAVVCAVFLGVLPRLALVTAGLTRLDDRAGGGGSVPGRDVAAALAAAHRGMVVGAVAGAGSAAAAGWLLLTAPDHFTAPLAVVLAVVLATRARAYPLVGEVVALVAAAMVVAVRLLLAWLDRPAVGSGYPLAVVCAAAGLLLVALAVDPPEHVRARLRRLADRLEAVSIIALLPLAIGVFGTYARLLHAF
jgi:type VII secretion integral membrane protein EccD